MPYRKPVPVEKDEPFPLEKILATDIIAYCVENGKKVPVEGYHFKEDDYVIQRVKAEINYSEPVKFGSETQEQINLVYQRLTKEFQYKVPINTEVVVDHRISVSDCYEGIIRRAVIGTALIPNLP